MVLLGEETCTMSLHTGVTGRGDNTGRRDHTCSGNVCCCVMVNVWVLLYTA